MISRRFFNATVLAFCSAVAGMAAFADNADTFWERILQTFGGGNRATDEAIKVADGLTTSTVPVADRPGVINELDDLDRALFELFGRRIAFHDDIQDYVANSKAGSISNTARASRWSAVTSDVEDLVVLVDRIQTALESSTHLRQRIDPAVLAELRKSMIERQALFEQLGDMPAPRTPAEIARLEGIAAASRTLLERTMVLQRAIGAARNRLMA